MKVYDVVIVGPRVVGTVYHDLDTGRWGFKLGKAPEVSRALRRVNERGGAQHRVAVPSEGLDGDGLVTVDSRDDRFIKALEDELVGVGVVNLRAQGEQA